MTNVDVVRDQPPPSLAPVDSTVKVPDSVRRAAAHADSFYKPAEAPPVDQPAPAPASTEAPPQPAEAAPPVAPAPVLEPAPPPAPAETSVTAQQWEHRYNSMKGRHDQVQQQMTAMNRQMQQMGDELMAAQRVLSQRQQPPKQSKLITPEDEQSYGNELIDLAKRAAKEAVGQDIETLRKENTRLQRHVSRSAEQGLVQQLGQQVPDWETINNDTRFKQWLRLPDIYSGVVRQRLLENAHRAADAPRVVAFFKAFVADETAAGHRNPSPQEPPAQPAPREAAVSMEALVAPGRARPASGDSATPVDKPSYTRAYVAKFYDDSRKGLWDGKPADKARIEADIFLAQREGRVRG